GLDAGAEPSHPPGHLVAEDPAVLGVPEGRVAAPEVQVGAADVGHAHPDQHALGLDLGDRHLADLKRLARAEEDRGPRRRADAGSLPSSKASCSARTASSAYLSSMTQDTAISHVETPSLFTPSFNTPPTTP